MVAVSLLYLHFGVLAVVYLKKSVSVFVCAVCVCRFNRESRIYIIIYIY